MQETSENQLPVKVQFKNFEPGEFTDRQNRTYEETISLIEAFPWEDQRDHLKVDLTNPSITLEGPDSDYLKLGVFYNGKFVLHYFDRTHQIFTKSFTNYTDAYPYVRHYYTDYPFDTTDLKREPWKAKKIHFINGNFRYFLTGESIFGFLLFTSGMNFILTLFLLAVPFYHPDTALLTLTFMLPMSFLIGGGLNLILFANYYHQAKGKVLIMSKGNDEFWYGPSDAPDKFDKKEIVQVTLYENSGRSLTSGFARIEIQFKDTRCLNISNLLINRQALLDKLFAYPIRNVSAGWPSIPSSSPTLS
jgi:hypothetical protein